MPSAIGESVSLWVPSCNEAIRIELDGQHTTSDSGAVLLCKALDNRGVIDAPEGNLVDQRNPQRIRHSRAGQRRTLVFQRAMGWIDLSDTSTLRRVPAPPPSEPEATGASGQESRRKARQSAVNDTGLRSDNAGRR